MGNRSTSHTLGKDNQMLGLIDGFYRHERGATATEYAMLIVFIALAIAVGAQALGGGLGNTLTNIGNMISTVVIPNV